MPSEPASELVADHTLGSAPGLPLLLRFHPGASMPQALFDKLAEVSLLAEAGQAGKDNGGGTGNWLVLGGIGMLRDFELGYFDGEEYHNRTFTEPYELVTLQGTVVAQGPEGQPIAHLHATVAGLDHKCVGGHLFGGIVGVTLEVNLLSLEGPASRSFEPSGLALLQLELQAEVSRRGHRGHRGQ